MGKGHKLVGHRTPADESPVRQIAFQVLLRALVDARSRDHRQQALKADAMRWLNSPEAKELARVLGLNWPAQITESDLAPKAIRRRQGVL